MNRPLHGAQELGGNACYALKITVGVSGEATSFPNPFNPETHIGFHLPIAGPIRLTVFDAAGRDLRVPVDGDFMPAGDRAISWDGRDASGRPLPGGVYLLLLEAGGESVGEKAILLK